MRTSLCEVTRAGSRRNSAFSSHAERVDAFEAFRVLAQNWVRTRQFHTNVFKKLDPGAVPRKLTFASCELAPSPLTLHWKIFSLTRCEHLNAVKFVQCGEKLL